MWPDIQSQISTGALFGLPAFSDTKETALPPESELLSISELMAGRS